MNLPSSLTHLADTVSQTDWAQAIAGGWMFPALETVHVFSLVSVLGTIAFVDWRLIGLAGRYPVTSLSRQTLPWTWGGFVLAVISGALMTAGQASEYITNPAFQLKLVLIVLAGINMAAFHLIPWRTVSHWDAGRPPLAARVGGALSLILWIGVITCGRWIAFSHGA